jgi:hypothetical protein
VDPRRFADHFGRRAFELGHALADHPLFRLERLVELAAELPAERIEYNPGDLEVNQDAARVRPGELSVAETIRRIETCGSWMVLKHVQRDPDFGALLDDCLDELAARVEPLSGRIFRPIAFLFVSSPRAITPFHVDPENNFLLQVRGTKFMRVFDPADRELVTDAALERIFAGGQRNLVLDGDLAARGETFRLDPGCGVHVPVHAPHYVRNGDDVSVSFSVTFDTYASDRRKAVYWSNHKLRSLGLAPRPPGARTDPLKHGVYRGLRALKHLARGA